MAKEAGKRQRKAPKRRRPARSSERRRPRRRKKTSRRSKSGRPTKNTLLKLLAAIVLGAVAGLLVLAGVVVGWFGDRLGPQSEQPVAVSWPEDLTAHEAAALLHDLGLTDSPVMLELFIQFKSAQRCFVPGPHLLSTHVNPRQLVAMLCRDESRVIRKLTIPEGFNRFAIAERLERAAIVGKVAFLRATENRQLLHDLGIEVGSISEAESAEGYLFPATYKLAINSDPLKVVRELVLAGHRRWKRLTHEQEEPLRQLRKQFGFERREILTLASMIEKEAAVADERPIIASVFLNRLRDPSFRPKYLQSDPTAMYGCLVMPDRVRACRQFSGKATPALNRDSDNRYSTYVYEGLPPGPIANPGAASIRAVLEPAQTPYLFFVAKGGGRHAFSENYQAHLEAVRSLRLQRRSR